MSEDLFPRLARILPDLEKINRAFPAERREATPAEDWTRREVLHRQKAELEAKGGELRNG